ncbi:MAG TPA: radical SAM protein [bacterium]|nr:radical SAM protein [bacterium]
MKDRKGTAAKAVPFRSWADERILKERSLIHLHRGSPLRIALVYPNTYEVGMANLGFQTVYRLFNEHPNVICERVFALVPMNEIRSLESGSLLESFDLIGFSLSFEMDIPHLIRCLKTGRLSPLARDRTSKDPLVFIGGVVAGLNPSPLLPFVDGLLVGEAEDIIGPMAEIMLTHRPRYRNRRRRLQALAELEGIYIPSLHTRVTRHRLSTLEPFPAYTGILTPYSHFEDLFVIEVSRGCMRNCRFCAAQKVYAPYRFRSTDSVLETIAKYNPGTHRIGLEGAGISDYPGLESLVGSLVETGYSVNLSSIRADRITNPLVKYLEKGGLKTFAMAPEAGNQELRDRMGKRLFDEAILTAADRLRNSSINTLKLYFIIGFPGETDADVESVIDLIGSIYKCFVDRPHRGLKISINAFIPKPFTEMQWAPMNTEKELRRKRKIIRQGISRYPSIQWSTRRAAEEVFQGLLSVGDARMSEVLLSMEEGVNWKQAMKEKEVDWKFLFREREHHDMPWSFIKSDIPESDLYDSYLKNRAP